MVAVFIYKQHRLLTIPRHQTLIEKVKHRYTSHVVVLLQITNIKLQILTDILKNNSHDSYNNLSYT
jgi:hypothetical protein